MKLYTVGYFFTEAFRSIGRNIWLSIASVVTMAISLFILGASVLLVLNSNHVVTVIESNLEVAVIMRTDITPSQVEYIGGKLKDHPLTAEVTFVSKEEGLAKLRQQLGANNEVLRALGSDNPLPDMYKVKAKNPQEVEGMAKDFGKLAGVEQVKYGQGVIEPLFALTNSVRWAGLAVMVMIGAAAVFLISTTIRLTVFARRNEISIMKMVGATNWFIRWPFLLEGTFLGLLGSAIALVALLYGYHAVALKVQSSLPFLPLRSDGTLFTLISQIVLTTGTLLGAIGSVISIHRFLKV